MVFLFIFLIIILIIITTKIKIEIQNLKFSTITKPHLNNKYQIKIKIYTFGTLPIFNIKINNKTINKILKNQKVKEKIKEEQTKIIENKANIDKDYEPEKIPDIYKALVERNSVKINQNAKNIEKIALVDKYTVADKVKEMYKVLTKQKKFVFNKLFSLKKREKQEVVTAFSGLLELSRRSKVETSQEEIFGDITVEEKKIV